MSVLLLSIIASSASGIFIELESSTIGSEPKEFSATLSNSASVSNSVSVPNLQSRQRSGHKAIRKKLRNLFNMNSIKANLKLKQTTTVGQTIDQGSTSHESKLGHRPVSQLCHRQRPKINQSNIKLVIVLTTSAPALDMTFLCNELYNFNFKICLFFFCLQAIELK